MKKIYFVILVSILSFSQLASAKTPIPPQAVSQESVSAGGQEAPLEISNSEPSYIPGEIIVKLKGGEESTKTYSKRKKRHDVVLGRLKNEYQLKDDQPLVKSLHNKLKTTNQTIKQLDAQIKEKFNKRAARASKDAKPIDLFPIYLLKTEEDVLKICEQLNKDPDIEYAEPHYIYHQVREDVVGDDGGSGGGGSNPITPPFDQYFNKQWPLNNIGQSYPIPKGKTAVGTPDSDINAPEAWNMLGPFEEVVVAVLDSGVDYNHPDLADNMWTDGNGFYGYDFVNQDDDPRDDNGHGTHTAGTIAAVFGNGIGISGIGPNNAKIMALKIIDPSGSVVGEPVDAINYAVANGADILSNSWGGFGYSQSLQDAINYAYSEGVIFVAAAGNNDSYSFFYPAAYEHVVAVAATDSNDVRADFSNYGQWVDVSAPGVDILSLRAEGTEIHRGRAGYIPGDNLFPFGDPGAEYYIASGTSMACPHAAGALAFLLSANPGLDIDSIIERMLLTVDSIDNINHPYYKERLGTGRINIYRALTMEPQPRLFISSFTTQDVIGNGDNYPQPGETVRLNIELKNIWLDAQGVSAVLQTNSPYVSIVDENFHYGDIPRGARVFGEFTLEIAHDIPKPYKLEFDLLINITNGSSDVLKVSVPLSNLKKLVPICTNGLPQKEPAIYGDKIVWEDTRNGNSDIYMHDLITNQESQITTNTADQRTPAIYGDKIVWEDTRNGNSDIYMHDLTTHQEIQITTNSGSQTQPAIYGDKIVWTDTRDFGFLKPQIYMYDLVTQQETRISYGNRCGRPVIYENIIVWQDGDENSYFNFPDIWMCNLETGQTKKISSLQKGSRPAIQGDKVVWQSHWLSSDIYMFDIKTENMIPIITASKCQANAAIYGDKIVWDDDRDVLTKRDIYMYSIASGEEIKITTENTSSNPAIYENHIVWEDYRNGNVDIYMGILSTPPKLNPIGNKFVYAGDTLSFRIYGSDADNDPLTYSASGLPPGAWFFPHLQGFSWTPTASQAGTYNVTFTVTDPSGATDSETVRIEVKIPKAARKPPQLLAPVE